MQKSTGSVSICLYPTHSEALEHYTIDYDVVKLLLTCSTFCRHLKFSQIYIYPKPKVKMEHVPCRVDFRPTMSKWPNILRNLLPRRVKVLRHPFVTDALSLSLSRFFVCSLICPMSRRLSHDPVHALVQVLHHLKNTHPTPCPPRNFRSPQRPTSLYQTHRILCPNGFPPILNPSF